MFVCVCMFVCSSIDSAPFGSTPTLCTYLESLWPGADNRVHCKGWSRPPRPPDTPKRLKINNCEVYPYNMHINGKPTIRLRQYGTFQASRGGADSHAHLTRPRVLKLATVGSSQSLQYAYQWKAFDLAKTTDFYHYYKQKWYETEAEGRKFLCWTEAAGRE